MSTGTTGLTRLFDLCQVEPDVFRTTAPSRVANAVADGRDATDDDQRSRVYGGQLISQALAAAHDTTTADRPAHSLHAYFLRGADRSRPITYAVRRLRDGRSMSNRLVEARQDDVPLLTLSASFQPPSDGVAHQDPLPAAPDPESLPVATGAEAHEWSGIDMRFVERWSNHSHGAHVSRRRLWMRLTEPVGEDPRSRACALAYVSDLALIRAALSAHLDVVRTRGVTLASVDHAIWFHRPVSVDEWLLYDAVSPSASGARALTIGHIYSHDGTLAATVTQEGIVRVGTLPDSNASVDYRQATR